MLSGENWQKIQSVLDQDPRLREVLGIINKAATPDLQKLSTDHDPLMVALRPFIAAELKRRNAA